MTNRGARTFRPWLAGLVCLLLVALLSAQTATYTMFHGESRRPLIVRTGSSPEMVALDQLAGLFGLTFTEDRAANGLVIGTRGDRILAFPGQTFVRTAGRVVSLDGSVQRDRNTWLVPIDFLSKALGPAIGEPVVVRKASRMVLVGNVRVPEITTRIERTAGGARVEIHAQPMAPYRVARDANRLMIRFDAAALDAGPISGFIPEFASAGRVEGTTIILELGPQAATHRVEDDRAAATVTIELFATPVPPPRTPPPGAPAAPQFSVATGALQTVVIDAGHGGDDQGTLGAGGLKEKDITLALARRLKASIESRLGLRVVLTRDGDENVTLDRRTELANNNKADVFLSLHANWSLRPDARGAQVYTLGLGAGQVQDTRAESQKRSVPILGGGSRVIEPVPWDMAQVPYADQSAALGGVLTRHLAERGLPMFSRPSALAPMRILMGANMPAVLIEVGMLSNGADEQAIGSPEWQALFIEGVVNALTEVRRGIGTGGAGFLP